MEGIQTDGLVETGIFERIQALVRNSEDGDFRFVNPCTSKKSDALTTNTAKQYTDTSSEDPVVDIGCSRLNLWRISTQIVVFGQCWNNSTENITKRNNKDELITFMNSKYGDRCMIWCFEDIFSGSYNIQKMPLLDFDLGVAYRMCCAVKCWLDFNSNNVAAFELKHGDNGRFKFVIGCIMKYCGIDGDDTCMDDTCFDSFQSSLMNVNTVRRYIKYFESASNMKYEGNHNIVLKQLIITTIPVAHSTDFQVGISINGKGRMLYIAQEATCDEDAAGYDYDVYRDEDYVVFSEIGCNVSEDIQIEMWYYSNEKQEKVLSLRVNPLFYRQGVYRFTLDDMELILPRSRFQDDFSVDLVLVESGRMEKKSLCFDKIDQIQGIKMLNDGFWRDYDRKIYERLVSQGINEVVSKICAYMRYDTHRCSEFTQDLESRGVCTNRNDSCVSGHVGMMLFCRQNSTNGHDVEDTDRKQDENNNCTDDSNIKSSCISSNTDIDVRKELYSVEVECSKLRLIEQINCEIPIISTRKVISKKQIIRKKTNCEDKAISSMEMVVRKSLHMVPLARVDGTIFSECSNIDIIMDLNMFEDMLCEPVENMNNTISNQAIATSVIDSNRLFLASLALRHLELKGITPENIYVFLESPSSPLELQDLLNIEKIYPNSTEALSLSLAPPEMLNEVEESMLRYSRYVDALKLLDILIFERKLFNEIFLMEDALIELLMLYNRIIDSHGLKILMKAVLEICNAINFKYSMTRKKIPGFRISSLCVFSGYKGKNNMSLFPFLFHVMEANGVGIGDLLDEFATIHELKAEELPRIREKINLFIEMYTNNLCALNVIDSKHQKAYSGFFLFACNKLECVVNMYKECNLKSGIIKHKFGDHDDGKCTSTVLVALSEFLHNMKMHFEIYSKSKNV
ncbi:hypothetical protein OCOL_000097 [Ordospora colligata]|uniref:Uncharacterized protein n=1 Tax=Ordospora colligata OC4 TaxID=1354746 RepID=A0A0B2UL51_9MICR|nr:uncharacterized protein M896_051190 [Ordospora colligata OC4]KHN69710.1 hypothetical protein M896_051190 [Ordospora colligata OC4]TBU15829.1 hypothetical protein CWI41_051180 [Ordospora colligata]TBU15957.1 hypothetical protein CWI40_051200 [Ordospora colligata]